MNEPVTFTLNGRHTTLAADLERSLLSILRYDLGLTGTKFGCGEGLCGACTVVVNRQAERACTLALKDIASKEVVTIEGLERNGRLHLLQQAFVEQDALQCGYCTPGMIMNAYGLLLRNPKPSRAQIIEQMDGNLCRCGAHRRILAAIEAAAERLAAPNKETL